MTAQANAPIIIKRKKVVAGDGHHGGAWKVAYADFVTAMMAFFMLMWLLNATTEQQRKGIADYFSPTIPINRISGGGDGALNGEIAETEANGTRDGTGGPEANPLVVDFGEQSAQLMNDEVPETLAFNELVDRLIGTGGESLLSDEALRHVITRLTDEGLVIEVFALPDVPLFNDGEAETTPVLDDVLSSIAELVAPVRNDIAIEAHLAARPVVIAENPVWDLSATRANAARLVMEDAGLTEGRVLRQTGHADRSPVAPNPADPRNERIEIVLLREVD